MSLIVKLLQFDSASSCCIGIVESIVRSYSRWSLMNLTKSSYLFTEDSARCSRFWAFLLQHSMVKTRDYRSILVNLPKSFSDPLSSSNEASSSILRKRSAKRVDFEANTTIGAMICPLNRIRPSKRPPTSPSQSRKLYFERSWIDFF